ncbi:MAG: RelA/SpoT family protein [Patescibacteria group bacterium]
MINAFIRKTPPVTDILKEANDLNSEAKTLITKAYDYAEKAHRNQKRMSGEPYFNHVVETAKTLAELKADADTIAAGLLHDVVEDTPITEEELSQEFNSTICKLVAGVTKLGTLKYQGQKRHVESLRKLFIAMASDIRVIMIKLADRLHNVKTLEYVKPEKRKRIALETIEIYAPLANRLGIGRLRGPLEDYSFPFVYPEEYKKVMRLRKTKSKNTLKQLKKVARSIQESIIKEGITDFDIDYRVKHIYSLYNKLKRKNMDIDQIYDLTALRIILPNQTDCYRVLGLIHSLWRPVPGKLKDYISNPKHNNYRSIHTTVFTGDGNISEIQIRDRQMHTEAEYGVASHLFYDETGKPKTGGQAPTGKLSWITELAKWQEVASESEEFINTLKSDFFQNRIFTFTPRGEVIELPTDAIALDFAYAIHSDVGHQAVGATINGKYSSLTTVLQNNDIIQIETKKDTHPTRKWLEQVKTSTARRHIKQYLTKTDPEFQTTN